MTGAVTKGWCPSLFEPMAAGDGLLVRVKPRVGGFSAGQARAVAMAATRYGSGLIEVTNRANLQIRGLTEATALLFAGMMVEAGLASPEPTAERRRNILVPISHDPRILDLGAQLEQWLESDATLASLPAKFGFAVGDGTEADNGPAADIVVAIGSRMSFVALAGSPLAADVNQPLAAVQAVTHAFLELRAEMSTPPRRMKALVEAIGVPAIFARAGLAAKQYELPIGSSAPCRAEPAPGAFGLGLPAGAANGGMLRIAADLAERFGNGRLRTTSARKLVLMGVHADADALTAAAAEAGFIVAPEDPRLRIAACAGKPACASAAADVRVAAGQLAAVWRGGGMLHVSGCAKGCAHPGPARVTMVATAGTGADAYDMILDGRAGDRPQQTRLSLAEAARFIADERP